MGLFLVIFPEDHHNHAIVDNGKLLISSSSRSSSKLFTKAQSTISLCALLVFFSLLLFTLSTFEPTSLSTIKTLPSRRFLSQNFPIPNPHKIPPSSSSWFSKIWTINKPHGTKINDISAALQGMGLLYRRGTRAMIDLVVCHVLEDVKEDEFRLFLRLFHRSGITAKSDLVFVFPSFNSSSRFGSIIQEENDSFLKLVDYYAELNRTSRIFDVTRSVKVGKKESEKDEEPLWGKKIKTNFTDSDGLTRLSYGSVVSFESAELDSENSLSGFLNLVPMSLRRWACYPMLLGRVRRNFKHVMLLDVKELIVLGDPLGRVRTQSTQSVYLLTKKQISSNKHSRKNSVKAETNYGVNSAIIMGGARGIRRLSNAMLMEIVRASMHHKRKNSVTESGILNQLVGNEFILKNVNLIKSTESIPEASSLTGVDANSDLCSLTASKHKIMDRGQSNHQELNSIIRKQICSCDVDSSVYNDC